MGLQGRCGGLRAQLAVVLLLLYCVSCEGKAPSTKTEQLTS